MPLAALLASLLTTSGLAGSAGGADELACFSSWSDAGPVLRAERLMDPARLRAIAEQRLGGSMLRLSLCRATVDGVYHFRIVMIDDAGQIRTHTVRADDPFPK
ncbi:MAG: hypothetical protein GC150_12390 [Rhizobiales bacterium]|nr:hypothetical protein [Hyphomicrobiales bacterium]